MGSDRFCFAGSLQHEQLWQYGNALEPQREGPEDFRDGPLVWEDDGQNSGTTQQVGYTERIEVRIMSWLVVVQHDVESICGRTQEDDLEDGVPRTVCKGPENI